VLLHSFPARPAAFACQTSRLVCGVFDDKYVDCVVFRRMALAVRMPLSGRPDFALKGAKIQYHWL
jgi:hypothetical protein